MKRFLGLKIRKLAEIDKNRLFHGKSIPLEGHWSWGGHVTRIFLKMAKSCKFDTTSEFLNLKPFSGENFNKIGEKFSKQFWPQISREPLKIAKSCKSDLTREFLLEIKNFSDKNYSQFGEKNFRTKCDFKKSKFRPLTPIFDPENDKIMKIWPKQWISRPQNFPGENFSKVGENFFRTKFDLKK